MTLTSSAESNYDKLNRHWEILKKRLIRRYGLFDYIKVKTEEGHGVLHVITNLFYISAMELSGLWSEIHDSEVVKVVTLYYGRGLRNYLSKYLKNQGRLSYSWGWVCKGWRTLFNAENRRWKAKLYPKRMFNAPIFCQVCWLKEYYCVYFPYLWNMFQKNFIFPAL